MTRHIAAQPPPLQHRVPSLGLNPRWVLIGATLLMWSLIIVLFFQIGYARTWQLWGVPTFTPPFLDFRLLPGTAETLARGLDPTVQNPGDPLGRLFNYPKTWYVFFYTGLRQDDTVGIVVAGLVLFFICVFAFPGKMRIGDVPLLLGLAFSPAAMLLYERGNVDIFVFILCTGILISSAWRRTSALMLVLTGAFFKIFPLLTVAVFLKESPKRFFALTGSAISAFGVYLILFHGTLSAAWLLTQREADMSYGANVLLTHYKPALTTSLFNLASSSKIEKLLDSAPYLAALVVLACCLLYGVRNRETAVVDDQRNLDAFRIGAAIYVGTFLLGNNFDYRLVFVLFIVPQTATWMRVANGRLRTLAIGTLMLCYLSCWSLMFGKVANKLHIPHVSSESLFLFDEAVNWALFATLACVLFISLPEWLKAPFYILRASPSRTMLASKSAPGTVR